jgi:hypothetical protein
MMLRAEAQALGQTKEDKEMTDKTRKQKELAQEEAKGEQTFNPSEATVAPIQSRPMRGPHHSFGRIKLHFNTNG